MSMFGWFVAVVLLVTWAYLQKRDRDSERIREEWFERQVKDLVSRHKVLENKCDGLIDRNTDLEELVDTLHDERAQIRRWYAEAPKWMAEPAKPE